MLLGKDGGTPYHPGALAARNAKIATKFGDFYANTCWKPRRQAPIVAAYYILFIVISAFCILSLFIGAVCSGMNDALDAFTTASSAARIKQEAIQADPKCVFRNINKLRVV